jgi:hypothetical protein
LLGFFGGLRAGVYSPGGYFLSYYKPLLSFVGDKVLTYY